eukprot:2903779-Karenia_brevis.AAC.1
MVVDDEDKETKDDEKKKEREEDESYSESYKEDEGKDDKKRRKQRMRELSPPREIKAAENVIKSGDVAPSPIVPGSVVKSSERMHQILLTKGVEEAANMLGIDESGIPIVALMRKQAALCESDIKSSERTTSIALENKRAIKQIDARETNKLL